MLILQQNYFSQIAAYARQQLPLEACGLIAGIKENENIIVKKIYFLNNVDKSVRHFSLSPQEQFQAIKDMRQNNYILLGNWHSHPSSVAVPSAEDIKLAYDPALSYLILSLQYSTPLLNSFKIKNGIITKEIIHIIPEKNK